MGVADNFGEAFAKAQLAAGQICRRRERSSSAWKIMTSRGVAELARKFVDLGFGIVATDGTADVLEAAGIEVERVFKVNEGRPNVVDLIKGERIQLIINTPHGAEPWFDEKAIRRAAIASRVPTLTTLSAAFAAAEGIRALRHGDLTVRSLQELHASIEAGAHRT